LWCTKFLPWLRRWVSPSACATARTSLACPGNKHSGNDLATPSALPKAPCRPTDGKPRQHRCLITFRARTVAYAHSCLSRSAHRLVEGWCSHVTWGHACAAALKLHVWVWADRACSCIAIRHMVFVIFHFAAFTGSAWPCIATEQRPTALCTNTCPTTRQPTLFSSRLARIDADLRPPPRLIPRKMCQAAADADAYR